MSLPQHRRLARLLIALALGGALAPAGAFAAATTATTALPPTATAPATSRPLFGSGGSATGTTTRALTPATTVPSTVAPTLTHTVRPVRAAPSRSSGLSTGAIVLAVLGAALAIGCAAWAMVRLSGTEPRWTVGLRHSLAEAGYRASTTWSELGDWLRLGR